LQFQDDLKQPSDFNQGYECFEKIVQIATKLNHLSSLFIQIKKEDRPGPEVAVEVIAKASEKVK